MESELTSNELVLLRCVPNSKPWTQNRDDCLQRFESNLEALDNEEIRAAFLGSVELKRRLDCEPLYSALCFFYEAGNAEHLSDDGWADHASWIISNGKEEAELAANFPDLFYSRLGERETFVLNYSFEEFLGPLYEIMNSRNVADSYPARKSIHWMKTGKFVLVVEQLKIRFPLIWKKLSKHHLEDGFVEWKRVKTE